MGGCSEPKVTMGGCSEPIPKVDLHCCQCFKKVKHLLCKFPQIRDQVYDQKQSTVTITVVCCSPEKIRDKLCCKGGKSIKSIEIKEPNKKTKPDDKQPATTPTLVREPEKTKHKLPPETKPVEQAPPQKAKWVPGYPPCWPTCQVFLVSACCDSCYHGRPGGPCYEGYRPRPPQVFPVSACCDSCYHGRPGGPCYEGYRPRPCYAYSYSRPPCPPTYYGSRCDYFSEENPNRACSIM